MKFNTLLPKLVLATAVVTTIPTPATAQVQDMQAVRAENSRETTAFRTRIASVRARVANGRRSGKITRARAGRLTGQISRLQASMTHLNRKQGFVSAAELASYNRTLGEVDAALDGYGVPRSYGNDGLVVPNAR